jgi:predicted RNase H-like HicB family nuclease
MKDYHINLFYSEEDGGWIADIPDLACCSAFGNTPDEALHEVEIAKDAWIKAAKESHRSVPLPRYRPAIYQVAAMA